MVESEDGSRSVELLDLWVAPGAPDVRLYTKHSCAFPAANVTVRWATIRLVDPAGLESIKA